MYSIDDKKSAIRDLQRFLFVIGQRHGIPYVSVDGFYGQETENAVKEFQRIFALDITGTAEKETFDAIYAEYLEIVKNTEGESLDFSEKNFPLKLGDSGNAVSVLNAIIRELSVIYRDLPLPYGDFYSADTNSAVTLLQGYFRLEKNGEVSSELFNLLKREMTLNQKVQKP